MPEFKLIGRGDGFRWDAVRPEWGKKGEIVVPETASTSIDWAAACGPGFFRLVSDAEGLQQTVCVNSLNLWYSLAVLDRAGAAPTKERVLADLAASFQTGHAAALIESINALSATITRYGSESSFPKYLNQKRLRASIPQP